MADENLLTLTADIVAAHVSNNSVTVAELPSLIGNVFGALSNVLNPVPVAPDKAAPAVSIRNSVRPDYLVCLEDGKKLTMLKRYLSTKFDLSPDQYRSKWGLPKDYPMVAPNYAERRRALAHAIGLGRKGGKKADFVENESAPTGHEPSKPGRRKLGISAAKTAAAGQPPANRTGPVEAASKPAVRRRGRTASE